MKLFLCPKCADVQKMAHHDWNVTRTCHCGASWGRYVDELCAEYGGDAVPLGFANRSLLYAVQHQPEDGWGETFEAFVIPGKCLTCERKDHDRQREEGSKSRKKTKKTVQKVVRTRKRNKKQK